MSHKYDHPLDFKYMTKQKTVRREMENYLQKSDREEFLSTKLTEWKVNKERRPDKY